LRARNIKPAFFTDLKIGKLTDSEKILFIGLWCLADKEGFFEIIPEQILVQIFPYNRKITIHNIEKMLSNCISLNLIVSNGTFGWIPKFLEHQRPHPDEAKSKVLDEIKQSLKTLINQSNGISLNLIKCREKVIGTKSDIMNEDLGLRNDDIMNDGLPAHATEFHFQGQVLKIPIKNHEAFIKAYPEIKIDVEYSKMDAWLVANPKNNKKNYPRFAQNWLSNCKPGNGGKPQHDKQPTFGKFPDLKPQE
jgi:hypothetical protein